MQRLLDRYGTLDRGTLIVIATAFVVAILLQGLAHAQPACSTCGNWAVVEIYSNADGSVQFLMLQSARYESGRLVPLQLAGQTLVSSDGVTEQRLGFDGELPNVAARPILIATQAFADLRLVKPDYIMPAQFIYQRHGSLRLLGSSWWDRGVFTYPLLPGANSALYSDVDGDYTDTAQVTNNLGASVRLSQPGDTSFRMTAIFSDQAGLYQYIQFEEQAGRDDQHWAGLTLEVTSRHGVSRSITFQYDLPSTVTAGRTVLIGTVHSGLPDTDFALPPGFLPTDGGTIVFAGVDAWDYDSLPANGYTVALRSGANTTNPSWFRGLVFRPFRGEPTGLLVFMDPVIEYYNRDLDHYFMSSSQPDLSALDSGLFPLGGWQRTGESFPAWIAPQDTPLTFQSPPGMGPVCRVYMPLGDRSSHFFSASTDECSAALSQHPEYRLETTAAFYASLPDPATGQCGFQQIPVYRLWNARSDSNHRYTTSTAIRDDMRSRGYVAEGYGPDAVAMCVAGGISQE